MRIRKSNRTQPKSRGNRLNSLIERRLTERVSKPLISSPKKIVDESTKINQVIKEQEEVVKTGKPLENNKVVDSNDRVSTKELIELVKPIEVEKPSVKVVPDPVIDAKQLDEENRRRLYIEELERRKIEDERWNKIEEAFNDEIERREAFRKELTQMKLEFDLYLKEKYPEIVGEKNIKTEDIEKKKEEARRKSEEVRIKKKELKEKMVKRVEEEKIRKQKEATLVTNTKLDNNVSTFLEEEIVIEQQEKKDRNPELDGLNEVQKTIKEVKEMEIRLGRPIIPHRDIVENEDSDFDSDTATKSTDILIKPSNTSPFENYEERRDTLEALRQSLQKDSTEEDFIVRMDRNDRRSGR